MGPELNRFKRLSLLREFVKKLEKKTTTKDIVDETERFFSSDTTGQEMVFNQDRFLFMFANKIVLDLRTNTFWQRSHPLSWVQ